MPDAWDSNDGQTQHLDENGNTVGNVASDAQGIPLWRFTHVHDECDPAEGECYATYEEYADEGGEPGTWHALDAASVAARREAAIEAIQRNNLWPAEMIDAIARAWGLDDA